ncbi:MAG: alkyl sulfatase [Chloroflexota bacterium]|nr:alkyl sulfatase [Chloroflexota bacterium]
MTAIASFDTGHTSAATAFDVRPLTALIGAEIHGVDLTRPLDARTVQQIYETLLRWKVVFFRDQDITPEQQIIFGRYFGEITPAHPVNGPIDEAHPQIMGVDAERQRKYQQEAREAGARRDDGRRGTRHRGWHTDITFVQNPALASILKAVNVPAYAGDTIWTNLVAAYQALSPAVRDFVDNLRAVHQWPDDSKGPAPSAIHPVVRVHPQTGERALFVNPNFTRYILDLSPLESETILGLLYDVLTRPDLTVRFHWEPNSIAFWDNRATAHLAAVDIAHVEFERRLHRITITGDVPIGPNGFRSEALVGDLFGVAASA